MFYHFTNTIHCHNITLYYAGGNSGGSNPSYYNDVLEYNVEDGAWNNVGTMPIKKSQHAVSIINYNAIMAYCN